MDTHQGTTEHGDKVYLDQTLVQVDRLTPPPRSPFIERRKPTTTPQVYAAIAKAIEVIGKIGVGKHGTNQDQGYKFRSIDDVYGAVNAGLAHAGLVILPAVITREVTELKTASGKANWRVVLKVMFTFACGADGSMHEVGPFYGEAFDTSDKATNKAMTGAFKYMLIEVFCIPMKGIDDADERTPEDTEHSSVTRAKAPATRLAAEHDTKREPVLDDAVISAEQRVDVLQRLAFANLSEGLFCSKAGIHDVKDLPVASLDAGLQWIKRNARPTKPAPAHTPDDAAASTSASPIGNAVPGAGPTNDSEKAQGRAALGPDPELPLQPTELSGDEKEMLADHLKADAAAKREEEHPSTHAGATPPERPTLPDNELKVPMRTYAVELAGKGAIGTTTVKHPMLGDIVHCQGEKYRIAEMRAMETHIPILVVERAQPAGPPAKRGKA